MKYDPHQTQKDIKKQNKETILNLLEDSPKRFTDLQKVTKFSPTGLTSMLKRLVDENEIEKIIHEEKSAYSITDHGKQLLDRGKATHTINTIEKNGGIFYYNYSGISEVLETHRLMGGIYPYLVIDKNLDELNLLSTSDMLDIEKFVLEKFIKKKNKLKQESFGKLVFGFVIDYPKLLNTVTKDPEEIRKNFASMLKILLKKYSNGNNKESKKHTLTSKPISKKSVKNKTRNKK